MSGGAGFQEQLRRNLAKERRPSKAALRVTCPRGHALLWLVPSPWGLVPVAGAPGRPGRFSLRTAQDGQPLVLHQWPEGQPLPLGACQCGRADGLDLSLLRQAVRAGQRKLVHRPTRPSSGDELRLAEEPAGAFSGRA